MDQYIDPTKEQFKEFRGRMRAGPIHMLEIELLHQKIDQLRETEVLHLTEAVKELNSTAQG
jgi:hypothetical protein